MSKARTHNSAYTRPPGVVGADGSVLLTVFHFSGYELLSKRWPSLRFSCASCENRNQILNEYLQ